MRKNSSKADVWMPLYIGDYLVDTTHLTRGQHGSYLLILMAMWKAGGSLENNEEDLAMIGKMTADEWAADRRKIMRFFTVEGGYITQKRLAEELGSARRISEERRTSGRSGADARWSQSDGKPDGNGNGKGGGNGGGKPDSNRDSKALAKPKENDTPSQSQSHTQSQSPAQPPSQAPSPAEPRSKAKARPMKLVAVLPAWIPIEAWAQYVEMRRVKRKPMTEKAVELIHKKLANMRVDGEDLTAVLLQSVENGWTGVFPVKHGDERGRIAEANQRAADAFVKQGGRGE